MPPNTNPPGSSTVDNYVKFGPTPGNQQDHWYEFRYQAATETGVEIQDDDIFMNFVDGERGDDIVNVVDNAIVDLGGPAFGSISRVSSGSGGGCFVETVFSWCKKSK
jgi:hypothetical protein